MSNTEASKAYELIVESVINEVREDFENAGIDEQTLQDLKRTWQIKLSETKVSRFTWDSAYNDADGNTTNTAAVNPPLNSLADNNTGVKAEDEQGLILPGLDPNSNQPTIKEEEEEDNENNVNIDGSNTNKEILQNDSTTNESTQVNNNNESEESSQKPIAQIELTISDTNGKIADQVRLQEKKAKRSALLDTDEVGSELDDSDDDYLISEGEDDGPDENLMLCLYDKVTRTKARWKCSLKDGVVTINHKDYTFQKAHVEAEWV